MKAKNSMLPVESIRNKIYTIRDIKVMLDRDLAELYGVEIKALNQAVKRNIKRFPPDFMFQLTKKEYGFLRSQIVTLKNGRGSHRKYFPYAFGERGIAMLSGILNSDLAITVNIQIMRAFVVMRRNILTADKLKEQMKLLTAKIDKHDIQIQDIIKTINYLILENEKVKFISVKPKRKIGFKTD